MKKLILALEDMSYMLTVYKRDVPDWALSQEAIDLALLIRVFHEKVRKDWRENDHPTVEHFDFFNYDHENIR